jgi:hypothetical protein
LRVCRARLPARQTGADGKNRMGASNRYHQDLRRRPTS